MRGGRINIPQIAGHHRPASETPFEWRFTGVPMMAQLGSFVIFKGIQTRFAKKPYMFVIFKGGSETLSLWIRACRCPIKQNVLSALIVKYYQFNDLLWVLKRTRMLGAFFSQILIEDSKNK